MGRLFLVEYNQLPFHDYIHCRMCRTRVAFVEDYFAIVPVSLPEGIFNKVFNVEVPTEDLSYHKKENGNTLVDVYCVQCEMLLGWKLIAVPRPCMYYKEGRFLLKMHKLSYWNGLPLVYLNDEQVGGANDQVGGANEQGPNDQNGGANEQNADQDGDANEQDLGDNEQNANQDGGINEDADQLAEGIDNIYLNPDL